MLYQNYLRYKSLRDVLNRKFEAARARENASVYIHDLILLPLKTGFYGEARSDTSLYRIEPMKRLTDHVDLIAKIANLYHERNYCEQLADGTYHLKEEYSALKFKKTKE